MEDSAQTSGTLDLDFTEDERRRFAAIFREMASMAEACAAAIDRGDTTEVIVQTLMFNLNLKRTTELYDIIVNSIKRTSGSVYDDVTEEIFNVPFKKRY